MKTPDYWQHDGLAVKLLSCFSPLYDWGGCLRRKLQKPLDAGVPVICVGNATAGGAGKTPTALSLAPMLVRLGLQPAYLSRGYGGSLGGPVQVQPERHSASEVGDEPLLLARKAPTWVARSRAAGALAAVKAGAEVIVMDDGFQNNSLQKALHILVVDGTYGFGNERVLPAGPLRERLSRALERADVIVVVGDANPRLATILKTQPVPKVLARTVPDLSAELFAGKRLYAFAGIAHPEKFHRSLQQVGAEICGFQAFADHHPYREEEVMALLEAAQSLDAQPVTTEKDLVRLPEPARSVVKAFPVHLEYDDPQMLYDLLAKSLVPK